MVLSVPSPPTEVKIPRRAWVALVISGAGQLLWAFNLTATNIAFDEITQSFPSASDAAVGWVAAVFFIGSASLLLLGGRLADRIGRRLIFQIGLVMFIVSAILSAIAPGIWLLIAARALGAAGAAFVVPAGLAMILPIFPKERHGTAIGVWSSTGPIAATISPSLSALVLDVADWRVLYLLTAPVALAALIAGTRVLAESKASGEPGALDLLGAVLGTAAIGLVVFVISQVADLGVTNPAIVVGAVGAITAGALFVVQSQRHPEPLLDLHSFWLKPVRISNAANFFTSTVGTSAWLVWPVYMDRVWDFEKWQIGLALTPGPITAGIATVLSGRLVDKIGLRPVLLVGAVAAPLSTLAPMLLLSETPNYWVSLFPPIALFGVGWAFIVPPLNSGIVRRVSPDLYGQVNAAFTTVRNIAGAVGIAVVVAVLAADPGDTPLETYRLIFAIFIVSQLLCLGILAILYPRD